MAEDDPTSLEVGNQLRQRVELVVVELAAGAGQPLHPHIGPPTPQLVQPEGLEAVLDVVRQGIDRDRKLEVLRERETYFWVPQPGGNENKLGVGREDVNDLAKSVSILLVGRVRHRGLKRDNLGSESLDCRVKIGERLLVSGLEGTDRSNEREPGAVRRVATPAAQSSSPGDRLAVEAVILEDADRSKDLVARRPAGNSNGSDPNTRGLTLVRHGAYVRRKRGQKTMKFFIDSADIAEIKEGAAMGVVDGVTTNPSLVAKTGRKFRDVLLEICDVVKGPVSAEVVSLTCNEMMGEARELAALRDNIVVKIPLIPEGLKAVKICSEEDIQTNVTLCFSATQALLAAKAGATYISPFVGRLDDASNDGLQVVEDIVEIYENYNFDTQVLVASVRHPMHVLEAAKLGAHVATCPLKVLLQLTKHPLTDSGLAKFLDDWKQVPE